MYSAEDILRCFDYVIQNYASFHGLYEEVWVDGKCKRIPSKAAIKTLTLLRKRLIQLLKDKGFQVTLDASGKVSVTAG
jgi:hypothetical protein